MIAFSYLTIFKQFTTIQKMLIRNITFKFIIYAETAYTVFLNIAHHALKPFLAKTTLITTDLLLISYRMCVVYRS
jgi:hypothetical protein